MTSGKEDLSLEKEGFEKEKVLMPLNNEKAKKELITNLRSGLGVELKKNPNKVKIIKKSKKERFFFWLKNIFTKF